MIKLHSAYVFFVIYLSWSPLISSEALGMEQKRCKPKQSDVTSTSRVSRNRAGFCVKKEQINDFELQNNERISSTSHLGCFLQVLKYQNTTKNTLWEVLDYSCRNLEGMIFIPYGSKHFLRMFFLGDELGGVRPLLQGTLRDRSLMLFAIARICPSHPPEVEELRVFTCSINMSMLSRRDEAQGPPPT